MTDVATWKRVSTDDQDTLNQSKALGDRVAERGYHLVREFDLPDLSASKGLKRHEQALAEVVADMRAGRYSVLVVFSSSRLDRRDEDEQVEFLLRVRQAGGSVESVTEPAFGSTDLAGRLITLVSQFGNADYSRRLSDSVRAANARIDAGGGFRGGRPPLGYTVGGEKYGKRLVVDEVARPIVVELFERVARHEPVPVISLWLKEKHGISKNFGSVTATIRRPAYWSGRFEVDSADGTVAVHRAEPLVSHGLWLAANESLAARPGTIAKPRLPRKPDYSGRLFCSSCGGKAYRIINGDHGKRVRGYYCRACHRGWVADVADAKVEARMLADQSAEYDLVLIPGSDHSDEMERIADELVNLPRRDLPWDEEDEIRAELRARRNELAALPVIQSRREIRPTGRSWAQAWTEMSHPERCAYLVSGKFRLFLHGRGRSVEVERIWLPDEND